MKRALQLARQAVRRRPVALLLAFGLALSLCALSFSRDPSILDKARTANPEDFPELGPDAATLLEATRTVFRSFDFAGVGARFDAAQAPPEVRELAGGQCDRTVEALRRLVPGRLSVRNLDLVYPNGDGLGGHTIAYVPTPAGHLLVDPTYGLLFRHAGELAPAQAMQAADYAVFRIGKSPAGYEKRIGPPRIIYDHVQSPRAAFALPEEPIVASLPVPSLASGSVRLGAIDGERHSLTLAVSSSYHDRIGNYFRPTRQQWQLKGATPGAFYEMRFYLLPAHTNPLALRVGLLAENLEVAADEVAVPNESDLLRIRIRAPAKRFTVEMSCDGMGGRFLDAVSIDRIGMEPDLDATAESSTHSRDRTGRPPSDAPSAKPLERLVGEQGLEPWTR